jgi:hypothetical protein
MDKYTPGPWHIEGPQVVQTADDGGINSVAIVNVRAAEWRANARVIAAAPDLLEACKMVLAHRSGTEYTWPQVRDALVAALKKAGEW